MSAGSVAAVIVSVASVIGVLVLVAVGVAALRTLTLVRRSVEELHREAMPVVHDLQRAAQQANADLERADTVLASAESVGATVDSLSRLLWLAVSSPVIKVMAFSAGTGRAARALRRRP